MGTAAVAPTRTTHPPAHPAPPPQGAYGQSSWRALGSYVQLVVAGRHRLAAAEQHCRRVLDRVDLACSRFRDDSDLTRANRNAGAWTGVDPLLVRAVHVALQAARFSDGLVDPCLGRVSAGWGYDRDLAAVRARPADPTCLTVPEPVPSRAWQLVELDPDGALRVPEGVALDLGATGKAFAADLLVAGLGDLGIAAVVSLGGDVAVTGPVSPDPLVRWPVQVAETPEQVAAGGGEPVALAAGGLATSTTVRRRWRHAGQVVHHLLDPRTGAPTAEVWRTVSVHARSCARANAASTAAVVLGARAVPWLTERALGARLVAEDAAVTRLPGWPGAAGELVHPVDTEEPAGVGDPPAPAPVPHHPAGRRPAGAPDPWGDDW